MSIPQTAFRTNFVLYKYVISHRRMDNRGSCSWVLFSSLFFLRISLWYNNTLKCFNWYWTSHHLCTPALCEVSACHIISNGPTTKNHKYLLNDKLKIWNSKRYFNFLTSVHRGPQQLRLHQSLPSSGLWCQPAEAHVL